MPNKKIHKLFPSPIFECQINNYKELNKDLEQFIYNLEKEDTKGVNASNAGGGWHSPYWQIGKTPIAKKFVDSVSPVLYEIITKDYAWKCKPEQIIFEGMWSIINRSNSYNLRHFHPNCHLSAAYYVKAKENCGKIKFYDPLDQRLIKAPRKSIQNDLNVEAITFTPQEGDLLIFPSYFHHSVEENLSGQDRIVISFNVEIQKAV
jgi:uncharacterized protein (TIGR02466 family)